VAAGRAVPGTAAPVVAGEGAAPLPAAADGAIAASLVGLADEGGAAPLAVALGAAAQEISLGTGEGIVEHRGRLLRGPGTQKTPAASERNG